MLSPFTQVNVVDFWSVRDWNFFGFLPAYLRIVIKFQVMNDPGIYLNIRQETFIDKNFPRLFSLSLFLIYE